MRLLRDASSFARGVDLIGVPTALTARLLRAERAGDTIDAIVDGQELDHEPIRGADCWTCMGDSAGHRDLTLAKTRCRKQAVNSAAVGRPARFSLRKRTSTPRQLMPGRGQPIYTARSKDVS